MMKNVKGRWKNTGERHTKCCGYSIVVDANLMHRQDDQKQFDVVIVGPHHGRMSLRHVLQNPKS